jgi:oligoribonuclease
MARSRNNLVWIDCEMTGLDPKSNTVIEIAAVSTDSNLNIIAEMPGIAVHQSERILAGMDKWNTRQHTRSGLLARVRESKVSVKKAEQETLKFVKRYCYARTAPLCGNSIGHDKRFIAKYMPTLLKFFHYQMIDVSSIKQLVMRWYPKRYHAPGKKDAHLALPDIMESIEELRYYRDFVFK